MVGSCIGPRFVRRGVVAPAGVATVSPVEPILDLVTTAAFGAGCRETRRLTNVHGGGAGWDAGRVDCVFVETPGQTEEDGNQYSENC